MTTTMTDTTRSEGQLTADVFAGALRTPPKGWEAVDSVNEAIKLMLSCDVVEAALDYDDLPSARPTTIRRAPVARAWICSSG